MNPEQESRLFAVDGLEVREEGDGPPVIVGYAAVFNQRSENLGGFVEEIVPGAFANTLRSNPDVRATIDHKGGVTTIGRVRNGTLQLQEDQHGLRVRIVPPDTQAGRDALTLVRGGYMDQMSFMFHTRRDEWKKTDDGTPLRRLHEVDLHNGDVSLVTYPAYPQTSAEARDMAMAMVTTDDAEGGQSGEAEEEQASQARLDILQRQLEIAEVENDL